MTAESANLDFLRATAVIAVFFAHVIQYCTRQWNLAVILGHLGVLLFFVHTSLVLMMSLERQGDKSLWQRFMTRRILRIYPLSITAVFVYAGWNLPTITAFHTLAHVKLTLASVMSNLALVQNLFHFASVPGVLWSLPFEIQMYLLLPPLFLLARAHRTADMLAIWVVGVALSLMAMAVGPRWLAQFAQYVPCFMAGMMAYSIPPRRLLPSWVFPLLIFAILFSSALLNPAFMGAEWPICFGLGCAIPFFRELQNRMLRKAAAAIAKHSYAIYLFHSLFLSIFLPKYGWIGAFPAALGTAVAAALAHRFIESPFIRLGRSLTSLKTSEPVLQS